MACDSQKVLEFGWIEAVSNESILFDATKEILEIKTTIQIDSIWFCRAVLHKCLCERSRPHPPLNHFKKPLKFRKHAHAHTPVQKKGKIKTKKVF